MQVPDQIGTDIKRAAQFLRSGMLVGIPTETVYGLAANAWDENAVLNIYKAKNRPQFNPLILHVESIPKLESFGLYFPERARILSEAFWPGPITLVIPKSDKIPDIVTSGTDAVAVRIPSHPITLELLSKLEFPLVAPSANPSGYVSPTIAQHVLDQLSGKVSYVLDGGQCSVGLESTIVSFLGESPEILRYGGLSIEAIEDVIGEVQRPTNGFVDNPVAPGMLKKHYATRHPLVIGEVANNLGKFQMNRVAIISFNQYYKEVIAENQFVLSPGGQLEEAAAHLFAAMRRADALDVDVILADVFPQTGLGRAINDRLLRASVQ